MKSNKSLSLRRNISWTFFSNLIYAASQWGIISVLSKIGNPSMVGQYALALAITAPFYMFTNLQLRSLVITDYKNKNEFNSFFMLRLVTVSISMVLIIFILLFSNHQLETKMIIFFIGVSKAIESISDVSFGLIQKNERMDLIAKSILVKGISSLLIVTIVIKLTGNIILATFGISLVWIMILIFIDLPKINKFTEFSLRFNRNQIIEIVKQGLPLGSVMLLISLNENIPRYFVEVYRGIEELGVFASIAYIMIAGTFIINSIGQSVSPKLAKYYSNNEFDKFQNLLNKLGFIGFIIGLSGLLIALLFGESILVNLYTQEFANYNNIFLILIVASTITYINSFIGFGLTTARLFKIQPLIVLVVILFNLLANLVLTPKFGLFGVGISITISVIVQFLISFFVLNIHLKKMKS
ncbi:oligosaccharide flippase family protein [Paenisporosarcina sp. NPDC076898]|uniref:oligosaccharide flippase family protein n=1 Tax=unclassified Paenisporosarcina TaxID=2642018 RepID=UPI003D00768D